MEIYEQQKRLSSILLLSLTLLFFIPATETSAQPKPDASLATKLIDATKEGDHAALQRLLEQGADPNTRDEEQRTPLSHAVQRGDIKGVRLLLDRGANPNLADRGGMTPLMVGARLNRNTRPEIVRALVTAKADMDAQAASGDTALQFAARNGFTDTVLFLIEKGARANVQFGLNLALLKAAEGGRLPHIRDLLKRGANPNAQPVARRASGEVALRGDTPLIEAIRYGHREVVIALLRAGADANLSGQGGRTPLIVSIQNGGQLTNLLLDQGANTDAKDEFGRTAIMHAVLTGTEEKVRMEIVLLLIERGANVNAKDNTNTSVLQVTIGSGNIEVLPIVLKAGARLEKSDLQKASAEFAGRNRFPEVQKLILEDKDLDTRGKDGLTSLMHAAQRGHAGMVKILLYLGSKPNLQDDNGMTSLMHAAGAGHLNAVRSLLWAGADPNMRDKQNETALMLAIPKPTGAPRLPVSTGTAPTVVKALLEGGADPNLKGWSGLTPLMLAAGRGHVEIVKALLAHGADVNAKADYAITAYDVATGAEVIELLNKARTDKTKPTAPSSPVRR